MTDPDPQVAAEQRDRDYAAFTAEMEHRSRTPQFSDSDEALYQQFARAFWPDAPPAEESKP